MHETGLAIFDFFISCLAKLWGWGTNSDKNKAEREESQQELRIQTPEGVSRQYKGVNWALRKEHSRVIRNADWRGSGPL